MNRKFNKLALGISLFFNFECMNLSNAGPNFMPNATNITFNYMINRPYFSIFIASLLSYGSYEFYTTRYSKIDNFSNSELLWIDKDGVVHFNLPDMPSKKITNKKFPTASGPMKFDPDRDLYYQDIDKDDNNSEQNKGDNSSIKLCANTVVKNFSAMDVVIEDISKGTGLSIEEIKKILLEK